jgi:hypothetical protein
MTHSARDYVGTRIRINSHDQKMAHCARAKSTGWGVCTDILEEIRGGRRGARSKVIQLEGQVTTHHFCCAQSCPFYPLCPPSTRARALPAPAARLHGALVGTEFTCDLCALLRNDGGLALCGKCSENTSCSVVPAHVSPG